MNKKRAYFYIQVPIILIIFLISSIFIQKKKSKDYTSDVSSLMSYDSEIYNKHKLPVGYLNFSLDKNIGVCSISGEKIEDVTVYDLKYKLESISYSDLKFELLTNKNEKYFFSEDEYSCKIILRISKDGKKILSQELCNTKKETIYMFVEMTKEVYERSISRTSHLSLQEIFISEESSNLYTCYLIQ